MLLARLQLPGTWSMHQWQLTDILWWGNGSQKSMWRVCHGAGGSGVIWSGSRCFSRLFTWHGSLHDRHFLIVLFTHWSIPGNHTFSQSSCFVFANPWWHSCASVTAFCHSVTGMMIRKFLSTTCTCTSDSSLIVAHLSLSWRLWALSDLHPDTLLGDCQSDFTSDFSLTMKHAEGSCLALLLLWVPRGSLLYGLHLLSESVDIRPGSLLFLCRMSWKIVWWIVDSSHVHSFKVITLKSKGSSILFLLGAWILHVLEMMISWTGLQSVRSLKRLPNNYTNV